MSLTLKIKDFQSLKKAELTIPDGITIITGSTNQGKSAVIRAIDTLIFNLGDDSKIRSGADQTEIELADDVHSILYIRSLRQKAEKTVYRFDNGAPQTKVGRGQLKETTDRFNISEVKMQNNIRTKLNFWYQNDKPFLMDKTAGQLYEFLSLSSCDRYTKILKEMEQDIRRQAAEINRNSISIDVLRQQKLEKENLLAASQGFDVLLQTIRKKTEEEQKLLQIKSRAERTGQNLAIRQQLADEKADIQAMLKRGEPAAIGDKLKTIETESEKLSAIAELIARADRLKRQLDASRRQSQSINAVLSSAAETKSFQPRLDVIQETEKRYADISSLLMNAKYRKSEADIRHKQLRYITVPPLTVSPKRIDGIADMQEKIIQLYHKIKTASSLCRALIEKRQQYKTNVEQTLAHEAEFQKLKQSAGYCPYCGTIFDHKE